jgi:hypothetical protein
MLNECWMLDSRRQITVMATSDRTPLEGAAGAKTREDTVFLLDGAYRLA